MGARRDLRHDAAIGARARRSGSARRWRGSSPRPSRGATARRRPRSRRRWSRCRERAWWASRRRRHEPARLSRPGPTPYSPRRPRRKRTHGGEDGKALARRRRSARGSARAAARWRWRRPARCGPGSPPPIGWPKRPSSIVVIKTTGDMIQDRALSEAGGKGLFTKEIDAALLARRDRPRGAFRQGHADAPSRTASTSPAICRARTCATCSSRARRDSARRPAAGRLVGTACLRRQALVQAAAAGRRPPRCCAAMSRRGCGKRRSGEIDATLLALAGLKRLGLAHRAAAILDIDDFPPAVGQGAIAITARRTTRTPPGAWPPSPMRDDRRRAGGGARLPAVLDGSCRTPIAGLAKVDGDRCASAAWCLRPTARSPSTPAAPARLSTPPPWARTPRGTSCPARRTTSWPTERCVWSSHARSPTLSAPPNA